jgi:alpha-galactosidase
MDKKSVIPLKIAYIGGGSRAWARKLMTDLAKCPDLTGEVWLYDIDMESARLNEKLGNWMQDKPGVVSKWRYIAEPTLEATLKAADFVVISIQPGTLEIMGENLAIAAKYGMYFTVGDTTGAPGLMRALFSAITYAGFARAIASYCPNAWVINYTNPMTVCTRTLTRVEPKIKVFGCCHEVFHTQDLLAEVARQYLKLDQPPHREEIEVNVTGINHFTWVDRAAYKGHDLLALLRHHIEQPGVIRKYTKEEVLAKHNWFHNADQVAFELFRRYGILGAAGDRHLAEFVPGFTRSEEELGRWGLVRTPIEYRLARWAEAPQQTRDLMDGKTPFSLPETGEEGVKQICAILGLGDFMTNVNVENIGQISNLPLHAVVESNAYFSRDSVRPLTAGPLPSGVHALISRHVGNQEMIIEAALTSDKDLAFQAIFNDPTTNLPIDAALQMYSEMLTIAKVYLPGWKI